MDYIYPTPAIAGLLTDVTEQWVEIGRQIMAGIAEGLNPDWLRRTTQEYEARINTQTYLFTRRTDRAAARRRELDWDDEDDDE